MPDDDIVHVNRCCCVDSAELSERIALAVLDELEKRWSRASYLSLWSHLATLKTEVQRGEWPDSGPSEEVSDESNL